MSPPLPHTPRKFNNTQGWFRSTGWNLSGLLLAGEVDWDWSAVGPFSCALVIVDVRDTFEC